MGREGPLEWRPTRLGLTGSARLPRGFSIIAGLVLGHRHRARLDDEPVAVDLRLLGQMRDDCLGDRVGCSTATACIPRGMILSTPLGGALRAVVRQRPG
jgi:hypothetical protein